jgi:hypothetical protein
MTCPVCYSDFTNVTRKPVACAACAYEACTQCIRTYLTSTPTDPHCMNCKHHWDRAFLDTHLTRSWREGDFKRHRERILLDRERSLLPATQDAVGIELQKRAYAKEIAEDLSPRFIALQAELKALEAAIEMRQRYISRGPATATTPEVKERRQFVAACPASDCRGFLSTAYKCGTCQNQFCAHCREVKQEDHTCDPSLVATIQAILKDSRPCPTCGTAISRVSGCDQMYCTQCDTPFSYATGKKIDGVIHNPHYFERRRALQAAGQTNGGGCQNGWPAMYRSERHVPSAYLRFLHAMEQAARHVENEVLPGFAAETDNTDLRVRYLLNELDDKRLGQLIQQRDRRRQRELELRGPLELFVITTMELCQEIDRSRTAIPQGRFAIYRTLITENVNGPLRDIGDRYQNIVPQINIEAIKFGDGFVGQGYRPKKSAPSQGLQMPPPEAAAATESH